MSGPAFRPLASSRPGKGPRHARHRICSRGRSDDDAEGLPSRGYRGKGRRRSPHTCPPHSTCRQWRKQGT
eukprot:7344030-Alexandrium_andersonii.AAC.1